MQQSLPPPPSHSQYLTWSNLKVEVLGSQRWFSSRKT
ncbi:mCG146929 [Mus musculus]|nr:mCG146929 [Mus musculus]